MGNYSNDGIKCKEIEDILYKERQELLNRSKVLGFMQESVEKNSTLENVRDFHTAFIQFAVDTFLNGVKDLEWQIQHLRNIVATQQAQINELNSRFAIEMTAEEITPTDGKGNDIG